MVSNLLIKLIIANDACIYHMMCLKAYLIHEPTSM